MSLKYHDIYQLAKAKKRGIKQYFNKQGAANKKPRINPGFKFYYKEYN